MEQDSDPSKPEIPVATLGDVLYPEGSAVTDSECEWVALVKSVSSGDQLALHGLYVRANRVVFTLAVRITGSRETAEEVTLDVFHDVWRRAKTYDSANGTVLGWIMNQARSRAIDRLRFEQRHKRANPHTADPAAEDASPDTQDAVELREQALLLRTALTSLSPGEQEAIQSAYFSELSHAQVAERLNQPLGTVKTRIRSGLLKLKQVFGAEGGGK